MATNRAQRRAVIASRPTKVLPFDRNRTRRESTLMPFDNQRHAARALSGMPLGAPFAARRIRSYGA